MSRKTQPCFRWIAGNHQWIGSVVVDEAHTILTSENFRGIMKKFDLVAKTNAPITLLTATLPPRLRLPLLKRCNIPESDTTTIHPPTDRKEHLYAVVNVVEDQLIARAVSFITAATEKLDGTARGIIFARTKDVGKALQKQLPHIGLITGDIKEGEIRNRILDSWKGTEGGGWIIGTSSLIQGVDYPDVRFVVFLETPWGLVDFVQGAGRGGRNGEVCRVVVFHTGKDLPVKTSQDFGCVREMNQWAKNGEECLRMKISQCMDGSTITCRTLEGAALCHVCQPDSLLNRLVAPVVNPQSTPIENRLVQLESSAPVRVTQLKTAPPVLQPARLTVPQARPREVDLRNKRKESMAKCISTLRAFGRRCVACHILGRLGASVCSGMCLQGDPDGLGDVYDLNKPVHRHHGPVSHQQNLLILST